MATKLDTSALELKIEFSNPLAITPAGQSEKDILKIDILAAPVNNTSLVYKFFRS